MNCLSESTEIECLKYIQWNKIKANNSPLTQQGLDFLGGIYGWKS